MTLLELFLIAVGLSMDAFAVAMGKGMCMKRLDYRQGLVIAAFFGLFQGGMPLLGWLLGRQFSVYITRIDHWLAFILLTLIGVKMVYESFKKDDDPHCEIKLDLRELTVLAIATSIDALAVGITFAFLTVDILPAVHFIGFTTLVLSFLGVVIGNRFGLALKARRNRRRQCPGPDWSEDPVRAFGDPGLLID